MHNRTSQDYDDDSDTEVEQHQFKIVLLGDGAVGKTSIAMRFTEDYFSRTYKQTIGCDFMLRRLVLPGDVHVTMQIWDIGGQSIGGKMIDKYIHDAKAIFLCYDISNYQSFQNLEDWNRLIMKSYSKDNMPYVALVANKTDLNHLREVKQEKHNQFADENDMYQFSMSAKSGDNVGSAFFRVAADLAGVVLTKPELETACRVVSAQIVNHQQNDPDVKVPNRSKGSNCTIS